MVKSSRNRGKYGPWNPGLESQIPPEVLPLSTMFRPENVSISFEDVHELSEFTGISPFELTTFRPERLVVHEVLIRVTADLTVPDGPNYEELGINLRSMTDKILKGYVEQILATVRESFQEVKVAAESFIDKELESQIYSSSSLSSATKKSTGFFSRLLRKSEPVPNSSSEHVFREMIAIENWQDRVDLDINPLEQVCLGSLIKIVSAIVGKRGRLVADKNLIRNLAVNLVTNGYGSEKIGSMIEPVLKQAVDTEHYRTLPAQNKPVVLNVKGASAAGKSTIRLQQQHLAQRLGIPWEDFALISPDYFRKYLLDYDSLGKHYKYAAMLTGHELEIVDKKLDRYMAQKATLGKMSHLLIDRFRFDSFTPAKDRSVDSKLLTRFGNQVFMFFMITPPGETVKRAWYRGLKTGRYKAVDDLLYHNVEAYTGMPELFFSWALSAEKKVHYEFLDNDVPEGELPKTAAYGWNDQMTILDVETMINIGRFQNINVEANCPGEIFDPETLDATNNLEFLLRCIELIDKISFADQTNGLFYAQIEGGKLLWCNHQYIKKQPSRSDIKSIFEFLNYRDCKDETKIFIAPDKIGQEKEFTIGRWV